MTPERAAHARAYARLIVRGGVNIRRGQALNAVAELGRRDFVRFLVTEAYDVGARLVEMRRTDPMTTRARYEHVREEYLDYVLDQLFQLTGVAPRQAPPGRGRSWPLSA
jgi:leucyl aminopeptidase (aminopeptidase T)